MKTAIVGLAFGDEGKGAIVDLLSENIDYVVRYNGGANAGHTVRVGDKTFKCHLLPSGVVRNKRCILTHGMVIDPRQLIKEIKELNPSSLYISKNAHCVMPWHFEEDFYNGGSIGTTVKGIGPCYAEKMNRRNAVKMGGLAGALKEDKNKFFAKHKALYGHDLLDEYVSFCAHLQPYLCDTSMVLRKAIKNNENILFESANGMLLDIDFGTYPFVTSSGVGPASIPQSCGLPNVHIDRIIGVIKSYMTRVGEGPFPTELNNSTGDKIREIGNEYGTTTGRPRRVGWLDLDLIKQSVENSAATEIALMHVDVLCGMGKIAYKFRNNLYETDGWNKTEDKEFWSYVKQIESALKLPIKIISTGPERTQKIIIN